MFVYFTYSPYSLIIASYIAIISKSTTLKHLLYTVQVYCFLVLVFVMVGERAGRGDDGEGE